MYKSIVYTLFICKLHNILHKFQRAKILSSSKRHQVKTCMPKLWTVICAHWQMKNTWQHLITIYIMHVSWWKFHMWNMQKFYVHSGCVTYALVKQWGFSGTFSCGSEHQRLSACAGDVCKLDGPWCCASWGGHPWLSWSTCLGWAVRVTPSEERGCGLVHTANINKWMVPAKETFSIISPNTTF